MIIMIKRFRSFVSVLALCAMFIVSGCVVEASSLEDNVSTGVSIGSDFLNSGTIDNDDLEIGNWIAGQRGMTSQNLGTASKTLSPLSNIVGNIIGGIVVLTFLGMFLMTAVDLLYLAFPPCRNLLYKGNAAGGGTAGGMMGGMGGRFSRYGGGMMGGMGGMGGNPQMQAEQRYTQWISDEAIQCVALLNNGGAASAPQMGMNPMNAGMMAQQPAPQTVSMRSTIATYFKKRLVFMIILAVCVIVLTSSVLLGTGVNLALWITKVINAVNANIPK